ncbi:MAG: glycosyltransferase family 4 protein [Chitinophagales bacterium]
MHAVFITPGFARDEQDTVTIPPLSALTRSLSKQGVHISIITLDYPFEEEKYTWHGVTVYACGGKNHRFPAKIFTVQKALTLFKKIQEEKSVQLIHSFWWQETAVIGYLLSKYFSIAHLTTLMGQDVLSTNKYAKWFSAKHKSVVALSDFHSKYFEKTFHRKPDQVIPWGIDVTDFPLHEKQQKTIDILGAGWLNRVKNFSDFIDVVNIVCQKYPHIKCVIAGDGEHRQELEEKISQLNLQNNIAIMGMLSRKETLDLMMRSKVFLHTSTFESFGYVFSEAIQAGASIVSYEVGIANNMNALIGNSIEELAQHVCTTLECPTNLSLKASVWTTQQTAEAYMELYRKLIPR